MAIKNGLQQIQMESCQPIKRLKDKKKTTIHKMPRISSDFLGSPGIRGSEFEK
jgi:hypothetical protein